MLPCWPDRDTIRDTMPAIFKEYYPRTTVILDATEIKVSTPSSLLLQSQTYSNYKSTNTFKALVGISPAGHVMFVSSLYTGSISDTELVERSGGCTFQNSRQHMNSMLLPHGMEHYKKWQVSFGALGHSFSGFGNNGLVPTLDHLCNKIVHIFLVCTTP